MTLFYTFNLHDLINDSCDLSRKEAVLNTYKFAPGYNKACFVQYSCNSVKLKVRFCQNDIVYTIYIRLGVLKNTDIIRDW